MFVIQIQCPKCRKIIRTMHLYFKLCPGCGLLININLPMSNLMIGNFKLFRRKLKRTGYEKHLLLERYKDLLGNLERGPISYGHGLPKGN
jgi:hypothetical protein